jgi:hypothetical protein
LSDDNAGNFIFGYKAPPTLSGIPSISIILFRTTWPRPSLWCM